MSRLNESRIGGFVGTDFAIRASEATASSLHAQHGAGIFVGLDGDVLATDERGVQVRSRVVVLPPHLFHAIDSPGPAVGLLCDPERMPEVAAYARRRSVAFPLEA